MGLKKLALTFLFPLLVASAGAGELPLKLSQGEGEVDFSVKGRAQVELRLLNDTGKELFLESYSKP